MGEEHDSWLAEIGVGVSDTFGKLKDKASGAVDTIEDAVDRAYDGARELATDAGKALAEVKGAATVVADTCAGGLKKAKAFVTTMYANAVRIFDESHKDDFGFWENRSETWGFRGSFRNMLRLVLYADD